MSRKSITDKPLKGKYDGRRSNGASLETLAYARIAKIGAGASARYLRAIDKYKSPLELFQEAIANKQLALAWEIRCTLDQRVHGRAFQAINPQEVTRPAVNDNRIQVAIQQLLPQAKQRSVVDAPQLTGEVAGETDDLPKHPKTPGGSG